MKSRLAVLCAVVCLCAVIFTAGCGSTPNVTVTINSPTGPQTVEAGQTVNITASASSSGGYLGSVTWSLTGVGCNGGACGTLTSETGTSAEYEAPSTPPSTNFTVYVVATAATGAAKSASIAITVEAIEVAIQNKITEVAAASSQHLLGNRFTAAAQYDPESDGVTWSLTTSGTVCSPACGTLSMSTPFFVTYTPPAAVPAAPNNTLTLTATSISDPTKSDTDTFTIFDGASACGTGGNESELNGEYAIMLNGWIGSGSGTEPLLYGASFGADGTGKITGGVDQFNPFVQTSYTGFSLIPSASSYSVGPDHRGCLTLTDQFDTTFTLQFSLGGVSSGVASKGDIILFNEQSATPERAAGILRLQDPSAFSISALASNYALGVDGWENLTGSLTHFSLAGTFAQSAGNLSNAGFDANDGGSLILATPPFGGFGTIEEPIATTTGTTYAQLQIGAQSLETAHVRIYVINSSELFIISNDLSPQEAAISGRAIATSRAFTPASIAPAYAFHITGSSAGVALAQIGIASFSGTETGGNGSSGTVSGTVDEYSGGTASTQKLSGIYGFFYDSGRLVMTGATNAGSPVCYLTKPLDDVAAFCISTDSTAGLGIMDTQPTATYGNSSLSGNFFFGSGEPGDETVPDLSGVATISSGSLTGTEDTSGSSGLSLAAAINAALSINSDGTGTMGTNTVLVTNGTEIYFINEASGAPAEVQVFQQ